MSSAASLFVCEEEGNAATDGVVYVILINIIFFLSFSHQLHIVDLIDTKNNLNKLNH